MAEGANTLRRLIALAVLVAGGGALLWLGQAGNSSASRAIKDSLMPWPTVPTAAPS